MQYKIQTNVPKDALDSVREAMGNAWAGIIGNYTHCSFIMPGVGYFLPREGARPVIWTVWAMEQVEEWRLEFICSSENMRAVLTALRQSHPYEEPPIEVYKLEDISMF